MQYLTLIPSPADAIVPSEPVTAMRLTQGQPDRPLHDYTYRGSGGSSYEANPPPVIVGRRRR